MKALINAILDAFHPKRCISCGKITDEDYLCDYCSEMLEFTDPLKRCIKCGLLKKDCMCKYRVFTFNGCISPFIKKDPAQRIMYSFKLRRKFRAAEFLANEMAFCVKNEYRDINFDGVCFVPMHKSRKRVRGFNQSEVLAERIAKILSLPIINALSCVKSAHSQHKIKDYKERFKNVKGIYKANGTFGGKTLLLVDDIMTTGATLNECAAVLLRAGADKIYCVTALRTDKNDKKKLKDGK